MPPPFDPTDHPALIDLGGRLRELAGDAAYQAGREYLRKGLVKQGAVAGPVAYATVSGSTDYRVSLSVDGAAKVTCTCPAHRRVKYCKHVVALGVALLERPAEFIVSETPPEAQQPAAARRGRAAGGAPATPSFELQWLAGLETVGRLLAELAGGGIMSLGPDKVALLANAGELVRALKLRRLGNLVVALQRAASRQRGTALDAHEFADLLVDIHLTRQAIGAHLAGRVSLDPRLAEDLLGKTWRNEDLERVSGLELIALAATRVDDGEFRVETSYLADLPTGAIFAEKQITPSRLASAPKPNHRLRLIVDEAGLYPGVAPRRIRLSRTRRAPLSVEDVQRLVSRAPSTLPELRRILVDRLDVPFGPDEIVATFRPASLVTQGNLVGAVDASGRFLALDWLAGRAYDLAGILSASGRYALFGQLCLDDRGPRLRCLSIVSGELAGGRGPIYPDGPG